MCAPVAVAVVAGSLIGGYMSSRATKKANQKSIRSQEKAAERERQRVAAGEAEIDRSFSGKNIDEIANPRVGDYSRFGMQLANAGFEQARGRADINLANRGITGTRGRETVDRRLLQSLALARTAVNDRATTLRDNIRTNLITEADSLKAAIRQGGTAPAADLIRARSQVRAAAANLPQIAVGDFFGQGANAINIQTQAQAQANATGRQIRPFGSVVRS